MLACLTKTTPNKIKFKWTKIKQYAFNEINRIMVYNPLITYPDFNETLKIHTNASDLQLGSIIIHKVKTVAFYGRHLLIPAKGIHKQRRN